MKRRTIIREMKRLGHRVSEEKFHLNIVGIRADETRPNRFDDEIYCFFRDGQGRWQDYTFPATTDPGTYWLQNPMYPKGTAILKSGQYDYKIGLHQSRYTSLVQAAPVTVIRDYDRDAVRDFQNGFTESGYFWINLHRGNVTGTTYEVDRHSAGCQVFKHVADFRLFIQLCQMHRSAHGNHFRYTLLDKRAMVRMRRRRTTAAACILLGLTALSASLFPLLKQQV